MKKYGLLLALAVVGVYGLGRIQLGESGALRFLSEMESLMNAGKAAEVCEMFHDEIEVDIRDESGDSPQTVSGGKEELCKLTRAAVAGFNLVPHSMKVDYTGVSAKPQWLHPWTSEIRYHENRSLTIHGPGVTIRTVSNDEITLVRTFTGVKLRRLKSQVYKAAAT